MQMDDQKFSASDHQMSGFPSTIRPITAKTCAESTPSIHPADLGPNRPTQVFVLARIKRTHVEITFWNLLVLKCAHFCIYECNAPTNTPRKPLSPGTKMVIGARFKTACRRQKPSSCTIFVPGEGGKHAEKRVLMRVTPFYWIIASYTKGTWVRLYRVWTNRVKNKKFQNHVWK